MLRRVLSKNLINKSLNSSQIRLTHILKRKVLPLMPETLINPLIVGPFLKEKIKYEEPREVADYIYDYVQNTSSRKYDTIKIILLKHVEELGVAGDIVDVNRPIARFQLISGGFADYASPYNLIKYKDLIESGAKGKVGPSSAFVFSTVRRLAKEVILVEMNDKEEWIIDRSHVRIALRKAGFVVPQNSIELPKTPISGPDIAGKQGKDFAVMITINGQEKVPVRCVVHHLGQPIKPNWFRAPRFVLLPEEQSELLATMPVQEKLDEMEAEEEFIS